jgi:ubiquitin fusion degradation protein 1
MPNMFQETFTALSITKNGKSHWNQSGKIILPLNASNKIFSMMVTFPLHFELETLDANKKKTHCGVWEFTAPNGICYLPECIMQNLNIEEGSTIKITNANLPKAEFLKLEPLGAGFLQLDDPKLILESHLPTHTCLTLGDIISVPYKDLEYKLKVVELRPKNDCNALLITETDCELEFLIAQEQKCDIKQQPQQKIRKTTNPTFVPFSGKGYKLS